MYVGSYLEFPTVDNKVRFDIFCNFTGWGPDQAAVYVTDSSLAVGSVTVTMDIDGATPPVRVLNDIGYMTSADLAFASGGMQPWPWHGVFTVLEDGVLARWDVTVNGSTGNPCSVIAYQDGGGPAHVYQ